MEPRVSNIHIKYICKECEEKGSVSFCNITLFLTNLKGVAKRRCSICRGAVEIIFIRFRYIKEGDRYVRGT